MLVTEPVGKGPQGGMRTGSSLGQCVSAQLSYGSEGLFVHTALCTCASLPAFVLSCVSAPTLVSVCAYGMFSLQMCVDLSMSCVVFCEFVNCVLAELDTTCCSQASPFHPLPQNPRSCHSPTIFGM